MRIIISERLKDIYLNLSVINQIDVVESLSMNDKSLLAIMVVKNYNSDETNEIVLDNIMCLEGYIEDYTNYLSNYNEDNKIDDYDVSETFKSFLLNFETLSTFYDNIYWLKGVEDMRIDPNDDVDDDVEEIPAPYSDSEIRDRIIDEVVNKD